MTKIDRYTGNYKPFGANSQGTERTIFEAPGATDVQSDTLDANINTDYLRGWGDNVVGPSQHPTRQQFNAGMFTLGQTLAYLHQEGVPEWDSSQEFNVGGIAKKKGVLFVSKTDQTGLNVGNDPETSPSDWGPASLLLFDSVADAKVSNAPVGSLIRTSGYYSPIDGGGDLYLVEGPGAADGFGDHIMTGGNVLRLIVSRPLNVKSFGAKGDGVADDQLPIQAAIDYVFNGGGELYIPAGKYQISAGLIIDRTGETGTPINNRNRVNIRGEGKGVSVLNATSDTINVMTIIGDASGSSAAHCHMTISNLSVTGSSPTSRASDGIKIEDVAYISLNEITFHNLKTCLNLKGAVSSTFDNMLFSESTNGVTSDSGAFSGCHANIFDGCEFRRLTSLAYNGFTGLSQGVFIGCQFEKCGTAGDSGAGGLIFRLNGAAGEVGPSFYGCYFEGNAGGFDLTFNENASARIACNIYACNFNRLDSVDYVTNNIMTMGDIDLNLYGCTFTSYNTYVPDAGRPYLNLSLETRFRDLGCRYEDSLESPTLSQAVPYGGIVNGSLGVGVTGTLPNGWSVAQSGTGIFVVTHNLGHQDYAPTALASTGNLNSVERCVKANNTVTFVVKTGGGAAVDDDFSFSLIELKQIA